MLTKAVLNYCMAIIQNHIKIFKSHGKKKKIHADNKTI